MTAPLHCEGCGATRYMDCGVAQSVSGSTTSFGMKKTPLKQKTPLRAKTGFKKATSNPSVYTEASKLRFKGSKSSKTPLFKKTAGIPRQGKKQGVKLNRKKLPSLKSLRNKCDALLTPIIKKMYPVSIFSGQPTEVAHHHIKKSESNACRYFIPNLIPLTHKEHQRLHARESYWSSKIVEVKGLDWWRDVDNRKKEYVKVDRLYYESNLVRLSEIYDSLNA